MKMLNCAYLVHRFTTLIYWIYSKIKITFSISAILAELKLNVENHVFFSFLYILGLSIPFLHNIDFCYPIDCAKIEGCNINEVLLNQTVYDRECLNQKNDTLHI